MSHAIQSCRYVGFLTTGLTPKTRRMVKINIQLTQNLYKYNLSVNNKILYFIYNKNSVLSG